MYLVKRTQYSFAIALASLVLASSILFAQLSLDNLLIILAYFVGIVVIPIIALIRIRHWEGRLLFQATHDALTGLANRHLLIDHTKKSLAYAKRRGNKIALLFIDLNDFKPVNDVFGHDVGDELLKKVAERLQSVVRAEETLARLGGDEFILLATDIEHDEHAACIAKRCAQALSQPLFAAGRQHDLSCSIGISLYPDHGGDVESLLKHADEAMYRAKKGVKSLIPL